MRRSCNECRYHAPRDGLRQAGFERRIRDARSRWPKSFTYEYGGNGKCPRVALGIVAFVATQDELPLTARCQRLARWSLTFLAGVKHCIEPTAQPSMGQAHGIRWVIGRVPLCSWKREYPRGVPVAFFDAERIASSFCFRFQQRPSSNVRRRRTAADFGSPASGVLPAPVRADSLGGPLG